MDRQIVRVVRRVLRVDRQVLRVDKKSTTSGQTSTASTTTCTIGFDVIVTCVIVTSYKLNDAYKWKQKV